jgi:cytochrome c-type biogenesis protein CcmF
MALARPAAQTQFLLVGVRLRLPRERFVRNDFSVLYVASNSNSALPLPTASPACGAATRARCCCG